MTRVRMLSEILRAALDELRDSKDDPLAAIDGVADQLEAGRAGWAEYVFGQPGDDTTAVLFHWSTRWGTCQECGAPAAFYSLGADGPDNPAKLCAVCAANDAVDGFTIVRIGPDGAGCAHNRQADVLDDSAPSDSAPSDSAPTDSAPGDSAAASVPAAVRVVTGRQSTD